MKVFRDPDSTATKLCRAFAAGVILALALVHIIPEAVEGMSRLGGIEYPLGGTTVLFGVALMIFLEHLAHIMHHGNTAAAAAAAAASAAAAAAAATPSRTGGASLAAANIVASPCAGGGAGRTIPDVECSVEGLKLAKTPTLGCTSVALESAAAAADALVSNPAALLVGGAAGGGSGGSGEGSQHGRSHGGAPGHGHVCVSRGSASNWVTAAAVEAVGSVRLKVVAYLFEMGCIFHSFIIGLSLGVNQTDLTEVRSLLIALAFHQWLESISLASVVVRGGFSRWRGCLMILTYSLTCPVGIAIGMGIAQTYDGESERARGIQGTFNGVSGGMLLYISLVQLVAEDMGRMSPGRDSALSRLGSFAALFAGSASMCVLAIWA